VLGEEESPDAPAPRPGGDGGAVLREAGFSEDEIAALVDSGALRRRSTREKT
jgi:crotonobetainyl-CoA:carnitine CoA-transferase CaiB-like acyl-CoA transferase